MGQLVYVAFGGGSVTPPVVIPTDLYVSQVNGNDANDGLTPATAVATVARVWELIPSGEPLDDALIEIHFGAGAYAWTDPPVYLFAAAGGIILNGDGAGQVGDDGFTVLDSGTITAGTAIDVTDALQAWVTDVYAGKTLEMVDGPSAGYRRTIIANTATRIDISVRNLTGPPGAGNAYRVLEPAASFTYTGSVTAPNTGLGILNIQLAPTDAGPFAVPAQTVCFGLELVQNVSYPYLVSIEDSAVLEAGGFVNETAFSEAFLTRVGFSTNVWSGWGASAWSNTITDGYLFSRGVEYLAIGGCFVGGPIQSYIDSPAPWTLNGGRTRGIDVINLTACFTGVTFTPITGYNTLTGSTITILGSTVRPTTFTASGGNPALVCKNTRISSGISASSLTFISTTGTALTLDAGSILDQRSPVTCTTTSGTCLQVSNGAIFANASATTLTTTTGRALLLSAGGVYVSAGVTTVTPSASAFFAVDISGGSTLAPLAALSIAGAVNALRVDSLSRAVLTGSTIVGSTLAIDCDAELEIAGVSTVTGPVTIREKANVSFSGTFAAFGGAANALTISGASRVWFASTVVVNVLSLSVTDADVVFEGSVTVATTVTITRARALFADITAAAGNVSISRNSSVALSGGTANLVGILLDANADVSVSDTYTLNADSVIVEDGSRFENAGALNTDVIDVLYATFVNHQTGVIVSSNLASYALRVVGGTFFGANGTITLTTAAAVQALTATFAAKVLLGGGAFLTISNDSTVPSVNAATGSSIWFGGALTGVGGLAANELQISGNIVDKAVLVVSGDFVTDTAVGPPNAAGSATVIGR